MTHNLLRGLRATHPGELLREDVLPALRATKAQIARDLRVSRQQLYDILNEKKPVTPQMALRLAKLLGTSAESWLRMQQAYDLAMQAPAMAEELEHIPTLQAA
jgi:addiction module HigA family antidote